MITAGFFQRDNETKREMARLFKEKNFTLAQKKTFIEKHLGYKAFMSDMTISEKEIIIEELKK